jgi:hypothetical protein
MRCAAPLHRQPPPRVPKLRLKLTLEAAQASHLPEGLIPADVAMLQPLLEDLMGSLRRGRH